MLSRLRDTQNRIVGTKQIMRAIAGNQVARVYIARDADPFVTRRVIDACEKANITVDEVDTMRELGEACGIEVGAAVAGIGREAR